MRNVPRRSFTVEAKSGGRRPSTTIPSRVVSPAVPTRNLFLELSDTPPAPVAEKRRILPNLIVPEVPEIVAEAVPSAEAMPPKRPRGRPRKVRPVSDEPIAAVIAAPEPAPAPAPQEMPVQAAPSPRMQRKRKDIAPLDLPRGERWKRRLGRWSR